MARGKKTCKSCGKTSGPRSWSCKSCGAGFIVKGVQKPNRDMDVTVNTARCDADKPDPTQRLWSLVELYSGVDEALARKKYGMEGRTWASKCGHYRIREQFTFMGVNMQEHFSKCVYLLKRSVNGWDVVRPKGRFKAPLAAIRRMIKDSNGKKVKATTRAERLEMRVSELAKRRVKYA